MTSKRIVGLDILRFLSMLGIIGLHVINAGGMLSGGASTLNKGVSGLLLVICYSSVDVFAMLSGYLYAGRENIRSSNLLKLLISTVFFCAVVTGAFLIFSDVLRGDAGLTAVGFFPFAAGRYWYLVCYIFLFLMIPYINQLTEKLSKRSLRTMIIILFLTLSVYETVSPVEYFYIAQGYSPVWMIFCYIVGSYVKLHGGDFSKLPVWVCVALSLVSSVIAFGIWVVFKNPDYYHYNSPFIVLSAVLLLVGFSKIDINSSFVSKAFASLSGAAFSVYIIHAHIFVMDYIITDCLIKYLNSNVLVCTGVTVGIILLIYLIGWASDMLMKLLFRVARIDKGAELIGSKLDRVLWIEPK